MAAVSFVAASAGAGSTGAPAIGVPAGVTTNDILIVVIQTANQSIVTPTNAGGNAAWQAATWTQLGDQTQSGTGNGKQCNGTAAAAGSTRMAVYWMRFTSGMTIGTTTIAAAGNHTVGQMYCFRGAYATSGSPFGSSVDASVTNSTSLSSGSGTSASTSNYGDMVIFLVADSLDSNSNQFGAGWWTTITGWQQPTTLGGQVNSNAGVGGGVGCYYLAPTFAGGSTEGTGQMGGVVSAGDATHYSVGMKVVLIGSESPKTVLNTTNATDFGSDATPTLEATATDGNGDDCRYNFQIATSPWVFDYYDYPSNFAGNFVSIGFTNQAVGQTFTTPSAGGGVLDSCQFVMSRTGTPTGNCEARLYALSGGVPTGSPLATSDAVANTSIPTANVPALITFTFSGANRYTLAAGTTYGLVVYYASGDGSNNLRVAYDITGPTHSGQYISLSSSTWSTSASNDTIFYAFGSPTVLLNEVSGTDAGFVNTVTGGDTDPFNSGEKVSFTVQAGDAFTIAGTYYWRARAIDPTDSNTYGLWPDARTFSVTPARVLTADQGSYTLSGKVSNLLVGHLVGATQGAYTLTGQSINMNKGKLMSAAQGAYALAGQATNFLRTRIFTVPQGAYVLTGQAANTLRGKLLTAVQGAYTYTGFTSNLLRGRKLVADFGSYVLSGQPTNLLWKRILTALQGAYNYTGFAAGLLKGKTMAAAFGAYTLTGQAAILTVTAAKKLIADVGLYALSGQASNLFFGRKVIADSGSYALNGQPANTFWGHKVIAPTGLYVLTGNTTNLLRGRQITAVQGVYVLTGQSANLLRTRIMPASVGFYVLTGQPAILTKASARTLVASPGSYVLSGQLANLLWGHKIPSVFGTYGLTGTTTNFFKGRRLITVNGLYNLDGRSANLLWSHKMPANVGFYVLTGQPVGLLKGKTIIAATGLYNLTGFPAQFVRPKRLFANTGYYNLTGLPVLFTFSGEFTYIIDLTKDPNDPTQSNLDVGEASSGLAHANTRSGGFEYIFP